jgi:DNA-binding transcriptional LysR family regulator
MATNINLNDIYIFHFVSELKSITAASKKLNTSKQTISRKLAQLEESLGVTLIARNTRNFQLTNAGQDYFQSCAKIIEQVEQANAMVQQHQTAMEGRIKICLPHEFNNKKTCGYFMRFMDANPAIKLDITLCDRNSFSMADGFDLAIRLGELEDSSMVARSLGGVNYGLVASPGYLKKFGMPQKCEDLYQHTYIMVSKSSSAIDKDSPLLKCRQLVVNEFMLGKQFASQGFGLVRLPLFMCTEELNSGELVILPVEQCMETRPLSLMFLKDKYMPGYVRKFIDYVVDICREQDLWMVDYVPYIYQPTVVKTPQLISELAVAQTA